MYLVISGMLVYTKFYVYLVDTWYAYKIKLGNCSLL